MISLDDYAAQQANELARHLADTEAALALIATAVAGNAHFPANGARVIRGWADKGGAAWITDEPVLWFDAEGRPVLADPEVGLGVDTLRDSYRSNERWAAYHPDAHRVDADGLSAREDAIARVKDALAEYLTKDESA